MWGIHRDPKREAETLAHCDGTRPRLYELLRGQAVLACAVDLLVAIKPLSMTQPGFRTSFSVWDRTSPDICPCLYIYTFAVPTIFLFSRV